MKDSPAVELRDVTVAYSEGTPDEVVALRGVSLSVLRGETLIITGGNGSGKSTLLKAIAGTAPVRSGAILIGGKDVTSWPPHRRAKLLGFIHQDPTLGTCPSMTVHENLRLVSSSPWWWPFPERLTMEEAHADLVGSSGLPLARKFGTLISSLSGGQRQATALILALGSNRRILLMDEFTSSLDDRARAAYLGIIAMESARRGLTILGVMHDLSGIGITGSRTIRLAGGIIDISVSAQSRNVGECG